VRCVMPSQLIKTAFIYIYDEYLRVFLLYIMLVALYDIFCLWSRSVISLIHQNVHDHRVNTEIPKEQANLYCVPLAINNTIFCSHSINY